MSEKENVIVGTAKSWGLRVAVPAPILRGIGVQVGDGVVWSFGERDGNKIAILERAEPTEGTKE